MKIYCLSVFTGVSDYSGLGEDRIVSTRKAVENYISFVKERIVFILSRKPYLRKYPVYVSIRVREPDSEGIYKNTHRSTVVLEINPDNSFNRSLKVY